jgi:hypothetical protein
MISGEIMTIVRDAANIVRTRLRGTLGLPAVISRGPFQCPATVVLGQSNNSALLKENMKFEADQQDFFVAVADYQPGGVPVEPAADDTISVTIAGHACVYEVRPASDSEQVFNCSRTGTEYRIKTKLRSKA